MSPSDPQTETGFEMRMVSDADALSRAQEGMVADLAGRLNGTLDEHTSELRGLVRDIVIMRGARTPDEIWTVFVDEMIEGEGAAAAAPERQLGQWQLLEPIAYQILHEVYPGTFADPGSQAVVGQAVPVVGQAVVGQAVVGRAVVGQAVAGGAVADNSSAGAAGLTAVSAAAGAADSQVPEIADVDGMRRITQWYNRENAGKRRY